MKSLNSHRMKLMLAGFMAVVVLSNGGSARADFTFSEPVNLGPVINRRNDYGACLSADGLSLFFQSDWPSGGQRDLWVSIRETPDADWGEPVKLGPAVNTSITEWDPSITADGLELYFSRAENLQGQGEDLYVTFRDTTDDEWESTESLGETVNSSSKDAFPSISADGLSLYFRSDRPGGEGGADLYVTTRLTRNDAWGEPVNLGPTVNSSSDDFAPSVTSDGLSLIFSSKRPGMYSNYADLWITTRRTTSESWQEPINLGPIINTDDVDFASISHDGTTLFLSCWRRPGGYGIGAYDIWQTPIIPIVDFNGDGIVDSLDMCIMVDNWHTNSTLCDIAPLPLGDGYVDVQDLIVLAEHLFEEILPFELVAYWRLDETEGSIAENSVSDNHGLLFGDPLWWLSEGKKNGALEFDGIDDYISTDFVLDPADGPFSVFAWITGGASGQVIISQTEGSFGGSGATWVGTDLSDGKLMTGLIPPPLGRSKPMPLESEVVITDGQWHNIVFVWDGSRRYLYVDGVEVSEDASDLAPLEFSDGGLYIGAGKNLEPGSLFRGLIDDVRIYNRALSAEKIAAMAQ
ncbi:MAG: LamG-like jellyroll fold domain-containing protein [Phycisphaerae bacterium]